MSRHSILFAGIVLVALGAALLAKPGNGVRAHGTLDQMLTSDPACLQTAFPGAIGGDIGTIRQEFVPTLSLLVAVDVCVSGDVGGEPLTVDIRSGTGASPGAVLATGTGTFSSDFAYQHVDLPSTSLVPGTTYVIEFDSPVFSILIASDAAYAPGTGYRESSGNIFSLNGDIGFRTFGTPTTATPTPSNSSTPTSTDTPTPTNTPTHTPTNTPTDTPTNTPTDTPTSTPTLTSTSVPSRSESTTTATHTASPAITGTAAPVGTPPATTGTMPPSNTATVPAGGAGAGGVSPPDTGSGPGASRGTASHCRDRVALVGRSDTRSRRPEAASTHRGLAG